MTDKNGKTKGRTRWPDTSPVLQVQLTEDEIFLLKMALSQYLTVMTWDYKAQLLRDKLYALLKQ